MFPTLRRLQASPAYTHLIQGIKLDLKKAMLAKNSAQKNTIRAVLAAIKDNEIAGGKQTEYDVYRVLNKMIKQRLESETTFRLQKRDDLAAVEAEEAASIRTFVERLPVASDEEVEAKTLEWLKKLHAEDPKMSMAAVYKLVTPELADSWSTAPAMVRSRIGELYKKIWG